MAVQPAGYLEITMAVRRINRWLQVLIYRRNAIGELEHPEGAYMGWKSGICVLESTAGASCPAGLHARHAVALIRETDWEGTAGP